MELSVCFALDNFPSSKLSLLLDVSGLRLNYSNSDLLKYFIFKVSLTAGLSVRWIFTQEFAYLMLHICGMYWDQTLGLSTLEWFLPIFVKSEPAANTRVVAQRQRRAKDKPQSNWLLPNWVLTDMWCLAPSGMSQTSTTGLGLGLPSDEEQKVQWPHGTLLNSSPL